MKTNLFDLGGKVALITGASRGIGAEVAALLARQGAHVIVSSRKQDACEKVAQEIRDGGGSASAFACHIGKLEDIEAVFAHVAARHGKLDILVNNAATNPYYGPIVDTDVDAFSKTVDVNIRGYFFMTARACRIMRGRGGVIVNVASVNGVRPGINQGIYSITKAAVINMTKAFALECGPDNIRVNALLPGLTDTKFSSALTTNKELVGELLKTLPLRRYAQPSEMAGTVLYLVSDASSFTTGACINVDGGFLI
ncbi:MAG: SDR family oxidoreductase [Gammaproteobacteria bacterium]|nr:SDR family oxidoreductase [Gammaproteobacteria bacterium]